MESSLKKEEDEKNSIKSNKNYKVEVYNNFEDLVIKSPYSINFLRFFIYKKR